MSSVSASHRIPCIALNTETPFISFLSDYGLQDEFVGVCHGVIARRCPQARIIDIAHQIPPQDVLAGALTLRDSVRFLPAGVHLAVVDPGVGASGPPRRRAVALRCMHEGRWLVGPDNGLLTPAARALGGVTQALDIGRSPERLSPVSATFHGRDIFAPVAAALADGAAPELVGESFDPSLLEDLALPEANVSGDVLHAHVISLDRFGNVGLDANPTQLRQVGIEVPLKVALQTRDRQGVATRRDAFADLAPGAMLLYVDSREMVALAVNRGSAAQHLDLHLGDEVALRRA